MYTTTGAEQTIAQLYELYAPSLRHYLARLTGSHEEAEDLAQETFLRALRHWQQLEAGTSARAWLFRIARNAAYDSFRRRRRRLDSAGTRVDLDLLPVADTTTDLTEREPILVALRHLPARERVPLLLHTVAGYPLDTIAAHLGWKLGTVKSRLYRGRVRFRSLYSSP